MRHVLQTSCLILGILCLFYYAGIVLYAGITADFAWIWTVGGCFLLLLWQAIRYETRHPGGWVRIFLILSAVLILAGLVIFLWIGGHIVGGMVAKPAQNLDYVVVLGAQVRGSTPSRALRKRLDRAAEYAAENENTVLILSGGKGSGEDISEAEAMYRYLLEAGVEEDRMLLEERSTTTKENLEFSAELADIKEHSVGVLSNDFHVYRAAALARKQGYQEVSCIPAPSDLPMQPHYVLREVAAVLKEVLSGNMDL